MFTRSPTPGCVIVTVTKHTSPLGIPSVVLFGIAVIDTTSAPKIEGVGIDSLEQLTAGLCKVEDAIDVDNWLSNSAIIVSKNCCNIVGVSFR